MSQSEIVVLNPLIEYPCMAPPVRNETNEGPTSLGPTREGWNDDGGVGPTADGTNGRGFAN